MVPAERNETRFSQTEVTPPVLSHIPLSAERRRVVPGHIFETAAHESGHGLAARKKGIPVVAMSVKSTKEYLGVTILGGNDTAKMAVVAAGGAVDTPYGPASGHQSDMLKVNAFSYSVSAALAEAKSAIYELSPLVRTYLAEIIGWMGNLNGYEFELAIERAKWEVALFNRQNYEYQKPNISAPLDEFIHLTVIGIKHNKEIEQKVIEAKKICSACLGIDGHTLDCLVIKEKEF